VGGQALIHLSDTITVVDFLDAGACFEGVATFVEKSGTISGQVADLTGEAKKFFDGDGYGHGDGHGYGEGYGYGYGDG